MAGLDHNIAFLPLNIAVLTVSDSRTPATDSSGDILAGRLEQAGHHLAARQICPDDIDRLQSTLNDWINDPDIDAVITTGGTGLTGRDVTPEAVRPLLTKEIDGFSVVFHTISYGKIGVSTLQSRAMAGLAGGTLIFCLPGSNGAVKDGWDGILVHELDIRFKPCNLVDLIDRFEER